MALQSEASRTPSLSSRTEPVADLYKAARIQEIQEAVILMERAGFAIDVPYFNSQAAVARADHSRLLDSLRVQLEVAGIQSESPDDIWASPKQLVSLLHDERPTGLGIPPSPYWFKGKVKLEQGERKTDRTALEWLASTGCSLPGVHPSAGGIVAGLMGLRRVVSSSKYLEKLPRYVGPDGFVHPVCGPAGDEDDRVGAITGRFGMKAPEAQQIPRDPRKDGYRVRAGFVAPPGMRLVVADAQALEVVILANICEWLFGDTLLLDLTAPGQDIHAFNAHRVFGTLLGWTTPSGIRIGDADPATFKGHPELDWYREAIKAVWYKLQYGGTVHGFAISLKGQDGQPVGMARAQEIVDALYEAVPSIPKWQAWVARVLRRDGGISALDGRYVDYSDLIARDTPGARRQWAFDAACRKADNFPLQSTGAHVIGCAMVDAVGSPEMRRLGGVLQLQVHDELIWRAPADNCARVLGLAKEIVAGAFPLKNLRASGGIGDNWAQAK